ncbi:unnamed protein product, partial [marine sediment metagenome]
SSILIKKEMQDMDFEGFCNEIFERLMQDLSSFTIYNFIDGMPESLLDYIENPKKYRKVKKDLISIYTYKLDKIIKEDYFDKYKITEAMIYRLKDFLNINRINNLIFLRDVNNDDISLMKTLIENKPDLKDKTSMKNDTKITE